MTASLTAAAQNGVFSLVIRCLKDQKTIADLMNINPSAGSPEGGTSPAADAWNWAQEASRFFGNIASGYESVNCSYADGSVSGMAKGTITFTGNPANSDTLVIAGVTITFVTTLTTGAQVKLGSTQAATMVNLVAYLNAGGVASEMAGVVTAVVTSANVITMTAFYPGIIGNLITCTKSCANISAITATLAGGVGVNQTSLLSIGI